MFNKSLKIPIPQRSDSVFCASCSQPSPLSLAFLPYYSLLLVQSNCAEIALLKLIYLSSTKHSLHFLASNFYSCCSSCLEDPCLLIGSILYLQFTSQLLYKLPCLASHLMGPTLFCGIYCLRGYEWVVCRWVLFGQPVLREGKKEKEFECFGMGQMFSNLPDPYIPDVLTPHFLHSLTLGLWDLQALRVQLLGQSRGALRPLFDCHLTYSFTIVTSKLLVFK